MATRRTSNGKPPGSAGRNGRNGVHFTAPAKHELAKARQIDTQCVPCPDCKAEVRESCVTSTGSKRSAHPSRRRMAIRHLGAHRFEEPEQIEGGVACPSCSLVVGTQKGQVVKGEHEGKRYLNSHFRPRSRVRCHGSGTEVRSAA